jgi:hypothetical protein
MPSSPAISNFLERLTPDLAASFSAAQLAAVELHFAMRLRPSHGIDWRRRLSLPFAKVYVVILAGRERRTG